MNRLRRPIALVTVLCLVAPSAWAQPKAGKTKPAAATPAPPPPPPPQPAASLSDTLTGPAKDDYESGKLLYADGDFAGAALKFQSAYDVSKDPRLLWNLAAAEKSLRHYARVERLLAQYVKESGDKLSEADRSDVTSLLDTVRNFIADVTVQSSEADAAVTVDEQPAGTTPLPGPLRLDMGERHIRVQKPGFKPFEATRTITGPGAIQIDATLAPIQHEGHLRVTAPGDATIRLDSKIVGSGSYEGVLPSGMHTLVVTAPGRRPYSSDVAVQDDQTSNVRVELEREVAPVVTTAPSNSTWLWIAGGVVAVAGLGVGAYLLFKPENKGPPAPVEGSLDTVELPVRF